MSTDDTLGLLQREFEQFPDDEMLTTFLSGSRPWIQKLSEEQRDTLSGIVGQMQDSDQRAIWREQVNPPNEEP